MKYWIVTPDDDLESCLKKTGLDDGNGSVGWTRRRFSDGNSMVYWYASPETGRLSACTVDSHRVGDLTELQPFDNELIKGVIMNIKETATAVYGKVKPYERYLVVAAVLIALDHLILKGRLRNRIIGLAKQLGERLIGILDSGINKLGGTGDGRG